MVKPHRSEHGQAIVLMALVILGSMGFVILAIDGGMVFHHRRQAQNAADAAALAAVLAKAQGVNYVQAALNRARTNGFNDSDPEVTVEVFSPPMVEPYVSDPDAYQYIQVRVTGSVKTAFVQLIYQGPVANSVDAIARVRPPTNMAYGYALFSTSLNACDAMTFGGNGTVDLYGGDAFSNSDGSAKVGSCSSCTRNGSAAVTLNGNTLSCVADFQDNGSGGGIYDSAGGSPGTILEYQPRQPIPIMPEIPCPSGAKQGDLNINKSQSLDPGNYSSISLKAGATVTMNPGVYCIDGDFKGTGGSLTGVGVTLKMLSGEFDLGGNVTVNLQAPTSGDWRGMLFYAEPSVSQVKITGNSGSFYLGTIYAPESDCVVRGTSGTLAVNSQVICETNDIGGDGQLMISYNEDLNYKLPTTIELSK